MSSLRKPSCKVFGILARESALGVLIRRGPSKWVQLITWDTLYDTFNFGQWFKGRIYEHRCDVSPDGSLFVYFAAKNSARQRSSEYTETWTAVSRPPFLTALALWPKGDCWAGGGIFLDNRRLFLNHPPWQAAVHPKHPQGPLEVVINPVAMTGDYFDYSMFLKRLPLYGWKLSQGKEFGKSAADWLFSLRGDRRIPEVWEKSAPCRSATLVMSFSEGHPFARYLVKSEMTSEVMLLEGVDWAEWDHRGRLAFTREGELFVSTSSFSWEDAIKIHDFSGSKPQSIQTPKWASSW
jgi:3',5'-cyclic AMP phosphodiesterase CpdA